jgi:hypothetical protein
MRVFFAAAILTPLLLGSVGCNGSQTGASDANRANRSPKSVLRPAELSYIPADAVAAMIVQPQRIFASDVVKQAAVRKEMLPLLLPQTTQDMNIDPSRIERHTLLIAPSRKDKEGGAANAACDEVHIVRFSEKIDASEFLRSAWPPRLAPKPRIEPVDDAGKKCFRRVYARDVLGYDSPVQAVFQPDEQTVVFALESRLKELLSAKDEESPFRARLRDTDLNHDLIVAVAGEPFCRAFGKEQGSQIRGARNAELAAVAEFVTDATHATLTIDLDGPNRLEVLIEARDAQGAAKTDAMIRGRLSQYRSMLASLQKESKERSAALLTAFAFADQSLRIAEMATSSNRVALRLRRPSAADDLVPKLITELAAAADANSREYEDRWRRQTKLREVSNAMLGYEASHYRFPQPVLRDKSGKPLLSWRVQILPELGQGQLFDKFRLNEPWDSDHNKKLVDRMPEVFGPVSGKDKGKTRFMLFVGQGAAFDGQKPLRQDTISARDGSSNTIMIVEAGTDKAVPWTKPEDLPFGSVDPMDALGTLVDKRFLAAFFDGHVEAIDKNVGTKKLRQWIDPNDGQPMKDDVQAEAERGGKRPAVSVPTKEPSKTPGP